MVDPNRSKIEALSETAQELVDEVNRLNQGTPLESLSTKVRRNQRVLWIVAGSSIVDVVVTLVLGFTLHSQAENTRRIDKLASEVSAVQTRTSDLVLCPLYQQFLNSDTPKSRELARANGQDMKLRDEAFKVIREGYKALDCPKLTAAPKG